MDLRELQDLYNNLKNTNPDALQDPMVQLLAIPQEQEKQEQVEASPDEPKASSDPFAFNLPSANTVPSSFDVSSGNQAAPMTMNGQVDNVTPPPSPKSVNPEIPALEGNPLPPQDQDSASASPVAPGTTKTPAATPSTDNEKNPLDVLVNRSNADFDARQQFNADEAHRRKMSMIPLGLAGVGDAISNAASAFGAKGKTGETEYVQSELDHLEKQRRDMFDQKLTTDPNSQISQNYRDTLALMMGTKATDPKIVNLSASQISQTLPEVEKFMQHKLQMQMVQAQKEYSRGMQQDSVRERQWNHAIQTLTTLRGDKPLTDSETMRNGAISAVKAIDNIKAEGRAPNQFEYIDLLGQLWKARTGSALTNEELKGMDAKTMQSKLGPLATYFTGDPKAITTPAAMQAIRNFATQSGLTADQLHEGYMESRGVNAAAANMHPEDKERLRKMSRGLSFSEATGIKPEDWEKGASGRGGLKSPQTGSLAPNEEVRQAKDGRKIVYDKTTKQPLRIYGQ
jgi:hypothetical protein